MQSATNQLLRKLLMTATDLAYLLSQLALLLANLLPTILPMQP